MIIYPSPNSDDFTACHPTSLGNGSEGLDSEPNPANHQRTPFETNTFPNGPARSLELFSTFGTDQERQPCSMQCSIQGPFTILSNGSIGQTVINADGNAVAWTTDVIVAQVICKVLNDHTNNPQEGLIR